MLVIHIDVGLWLRQTFIEELPGQFGPDTFEIRAASFAAANRMTERALSFAEKDLLPDGGQILLVLDGGNVELLDGGRQGRHLRHPERDQRKGTQHH